MNRTRVFLIAAFVVGCSGSRDATVTPEPAPSTAPTTVAPTTTTPTPPPTTTSETVEVEIDSGIPPAPLSETTTARDVRDRYVPWLDVQSVRLPAGETVHVEHPNATIRSRVNALLDEQLVTFAARARAAADADSAGAETSTPSCHSVLATRTMVSVVCETDWYPDVRGASDNFFVEGTSFEISGEEVRPVVVASALVDGANIDAELARALDAALAANDLSTGEGAREAWGRVTQVIDEDGIHCFWTGQDVGQVDGVVPYASILDRIRGDGPIARLLRVGSFARGAARPVAAAPGEPAEGPWAVGVPVPQTEAATRWLALPARLRPAVSMFLSADGSLAQLGVTTNVGLDVAREVATALHGSLVAPAEGASLRRPQIFRANASVNVRAAASSGDAWVGTLPRGATLVVPVDPDVATPASWVRVLVAPGVAGFSASRFLDPSDCVPDPTSALASVPADRREEATRNVLRIVATSFEGGRSAPAALFVSHAGSESWVSLRSLSTSCHVGDEIGAWTVDGTVVDALVTRTTQQGGETLVLVDVAAGTELETTWRALRVGTASPVWSHEHSAHPSVANDVVAPARRGPSGRGFWPLAIVVRGQPIVPFRWSGATLEEDSP